MLNSVLLIDALILVIAFSLTTEKKILRNLEIARRVIYRLFITLKLFMVKRKLDKAQKRMDKLKKEWINSKKVFNLLAYYSKRQITIISNLFIILLSKVANMTTGILIAFEGFEGSGKTTQV